MIWNIDVLYVCMCVCMFARARAYEHTHKEAQCDCPVALGLFFVSLLAPQTLSCGQAKIRGYLFTHIKGVSDY